MVTYFKNGVYALSIGYNQAITKRGYANVKHLSENCISHPIFFFQYIYAEILKLYRRPFSVQELMEKFNKFLKNVNEWDELSEKERENSFIMFKRLMERPIYRDIPVEQRESALNEVGMMF